MTHPKGKVAYNEHHAADKRRALVIHLLAAVSAVIVTILFVVL